MKVVWKFRPLAVGVEVQIVHDLSFRVPPAGTCRGTDHRRIFYQSRRHADAAAYEGPRGEKMRRVVITGVGPITPIGIGKEAFWEAIKNKKSGIGPVSTFDASIFKATSAAEISNWSPETIFPPHRLKAIGSLRAILSGLGQARPGRQRPGLFARRSS